MRAKMSRLNRGGAVEASVVNGLLGNLLDADKERVLLYGRLGSRDMRSGASIFGAAAADPMDSAEGGED